MKNKLTHLVEKSGSEYELWAQISPSQAPTGYSTLRIYSLYSGAKDPELPWERAKMFLSTDSLDRLIDTLTEYRKGI